MGGYKEVGHFVMRGIFFILCRRDIKVPYIDHLTSSFSVPRIGTELPKRL